jgi:hypothetical protein
VRNANALRWGAVLAAAGLSIAACAGGAPRSVPPDVPEVYIQQIDQILANDDVSESQRRVLEDYAVSDAEYGAARESFRSCVEPHGIDVELQDGQVTYTPTSRYTAQFGSLDEALAAADRVVEECDAEHLLFVAMMYTSLRENPGGLSFIEAVRACMDRLGLNEGRDLSDDELQARLDADEAFLFECRVDPWTVAREGRLPYEVSPPPGGQP